MKVEVYIDPPRGFGEYNGISMVLILVKIIYGICQDPKTIFCKLRAVFLERVFIQSKLDPYIFMKYIMVFLVYVDNTIIAGP